MFDVYLSIDPSSSLCYDPDFLLPSPLTCHMCTRYLRDLVAVRVVCLLGNCLLPLEQHLVPHLDLILLSPSMSVCVFFCLAASSLCWASCWLLEVE